MISSVNFQQNGRQNAGNNWQGSPNGRRRRTRQQDSMPLPPPKPQFLILSSTDSDDDLQVITPKQDSSTTALKDVSVSSSSSSDDDDQPLESVNWAAPNSRRRTDRPHIHTVRANEVVHKDEEPHTQPPPSKRRKKRRTTTKSRDDDEEPVESSRKRRTRTESGDEEQIPPEQREINVKRRKKRRVVKKVVAEQEEEDGQEEIKVHTKKMRRKKSREGGAVVIETPEPHSRTTEDRSDSITLPKTEELGERVLDPLDIEDTELFDVIRKKKLFGMPEFLLMNRDRSILSATPGKIAEGKGYKIIQKTSKGETFLGFLRIHQSSQRFTYYIMDNQQKGEFFGIFFSRPVKGPKNGRMIILTFPKDFEAINPATKELNLSRISLQIDKENKMAIKKEEQKVKEEEKKEKERIKEEKRRERERIKEEKRREKERLKEEKNWGKPSKRRKNSKENEEEDFVLSDDERDNPRTKTLSDSDEEPLELIDREKYQIYYSDIPYKQEDGSYKLEYGGAEVTESTKNFVIRQKNSDKCMIMFFKLSGDIFKIRYAEPFTEDSAFAFALSALLYSV